MVFSGFKASRPRSKTSHSSSSEARQAEEDYSLHIEQQIRVQKWLEELPDAPGDKQKLDDFQRAR